MANTRILEQAQRDVSEEERARDPKVVVDRRRGQPALLKEIALEIAVEGPPHAIVAERGCSLHDVHQPQMLQEQAQCPGIGVPQAPLPSSIREEALQDRLAEIVGLQAPTAYPLTEVGDHPKRSRSNCWKWIGPEFTSPST
jgi:hypothetical protein